MFSEIKGFKRPDGSVAWTRTPGFMALITGALLRDLDKSIGDEVTVGDWNFRVCCWLSSWRGLGVDAAVMMPDGIRFHVYRAYNAVRGFVGYYIRPITRKWRLRGLV